jgi:hypothetical protein
MRGIRRVSVDASSGILLTLPSERVAEQELGVIAQGAVGAADNLAAAQLIKDCTIPGK